MGSKNIFYAIVFIFLIFGILGINSLLIDDEGLNTMIIQELDEGKYPGFQDHPPIGVVSLYVNNLLMSFSNFLGFSLPIRFLPFIFGLVLLLFSYKFAREVYGEKIALLSMAIMAGSFYFIFASLLTDIDGNILTLFFTLTLYSYYKFVKSKHVSKKWLVLSGLFFGLTMLTKYIAITLLPIILLFEFFYSGTKFSVFDKKKITDLATIFFIAFAIFLIFPIITFLSGQTVIFDNTVSWGIKYSSKSLDIMTIIKASLKHVYRIVQYGTPLLLFFPILAFTKLRKKDELIFVLWAAGFFIMDIFLNTLGNIARYQMLMIPALSILSASAIIRSFEWNVQTRQIIKKTIIAFVIFLAIFILFNIGINGTTPFSFYFFNLDLLLSNAPVWYTSTSGPMFMVSIYSLLFVGFLSTLFFAYYFVSQNESFKRNILIVVIGLSLAFNVVLLEEYLFGLQSPSYETAIRGMVTYGETHEWKKPLFSIDEEVAYYLGENYYTFKDLSSSENRVFLPGGGTVFWLNMPEKRGGFMWNDVQDNCDLKETIVDKGFEIGYIFTCDGK